MITDPTWIFFIVLSIILFAPMIFSKLHIPHLVGMILAGVLVGEHGFNLLQRDASFELFGKVGIYFIMFLAGLEMDMENLKRNRTTGLIFGAITTIVPFLFGLIAGVWFLGYSLPASMLLACIFASHTLVSYTICSRYGVHRDSSVTISIIATMFALLSALIFLAGMAGVLRSDIQEGTTGETPSMAVFWTLFAVKLTAFLAFMFVVLPRIVRVFFRKFTEPIMQFTFTLAVVFFCAAMAAELCGLEGIFGAFLSGLVLNRFVPHTSPLMNRLEFVGNALFVPYFLIGVGMLVNVAPLFHEAGAVRVVIVMVIAGTVSKFFAANIARKIFKFSRPQGLMMFGLTEAHAAGALAMVLVGTKLEVAPGVPLMDNAVLDGVVMTILISCIISSIVTDQASKQLRLSIDTGHTSATDGQADGRRDSTALDDEKMLIPVNDKDNIQQLVSTAIMMRNQKLNRGLICLNLINDSDHSPQTQQHARECLELAHRIAAAADVPAQTQTRLAVNFVTATIHAMHENDASEILIGLHRRRDKNDSYFGRFAQALIEGTDRQVSIVHLTQPANTLRRIFCAAPPKAQYEKGFYRWINRVARMAEDLGCRLIFYAPEDTATIIQRYMLQRHHSVRAEYELMDNWADFPALRYEVRTEDLLVVIASRHGSISYDRTHKQLQQHLSTHFSAISQLVIFPDQEHETPADSLLLANAKAANGPQTIITRWLSKWITEAM